MNLTSFGLILISLSQTVSAILDNYAVRSTDRPWMSEWANRPRPGWTITRRPFGTVPVTCLYDALDGLCDRFEILVYEIKYTDCDSTVLVCRCGNSIGTDAIDNLARRLATLPVRARSWAQIFRTWGVHPRNPSLAGSSDVCLDINFFNGGSTNFNVLTHEIAHNLDYWVANGITTVPIIQYSATQRWRDITALDSCVPTEYSKISYSELFAEVAVDAFYEENIGPLPVTTTCMKNMLTEVRTILRPYIKYNAANTCNYRFAPSGDVCMGPAARAQGLCNGVADLEGNTARLATGGGSDSTYICSEFQFGPAQAQTNLTVRA